MKKKRSFLVLASLAIAWIAEVPRAAPAFNSVSDVADPDTYTCAQPGFISFEDLGDAANLSSGSIAGVQFTTTGGFTWQVGDFGTGAYNGKYPAGGYASQGTHWAWLGPDQGGGRIDFVNGPASTFSLLVSTHSTPVFLEAYDAHGALLETAGPSSVNYNTGHMDELKIARPAADMAYVIVHDSGNFFVVDSVCTDAPRVAGGNPRNHFMCYRAHTTKGTPTFVPVNGLHAADRFTSLTVDVKKTKSLCAAADENQQDPTAPSDPDGLQAYAVRKHRGTPALPTVRNYRIVNEFGTLFVDILRPRRLFVPSAASLAASPPAPAAPAVDHFDCYKVKRAKGTPKFRPVLGVPVADRFGARKLLVLRPTLLCAPADTNGQQPGADTRPALLMCYRVKPAPGSAPFVRISPVYVTDEFGAETVDTIKPGELCVPSFKGS